ncbi:MAG: MBOAT family O-acyltransferase [Candidatus Binatia bacterium]
MAVWASIEASALLLGVRLRPNFARILSCENPSELWRSWRGSFTNWLLQHVYAPLGANRRHQALNIAAAFAVSLVWHWAGLAFLGPRFGWRTLVPMTAWAVLNAGAVIGHMQLQRRCITLAPAATPVLVRRGTKIALTWILGSFSAILPLFQGETLARFPGYVRLLLGLGP